MSIRKKILLYFSVVTIVLLAAAQLLIYTLFAEYRVEDFNQQQREKISTTLNLLTEIRHLDATLLQVIDSVTLKELYDEKLLIYNENKDLVYSNIDDTPFESAGEILARLEPRENDLIEQRDGRYDVVGFYLENKGTGFYAISKAHDLYGYHKLNYLKFVLLITFVVLALVVVFMAYYLAKRIATPIVDLTRKIGNFNFDEMNQPIRIKAGTTEVAILADRFNELMLQMNEAFSFQKHAIHHISHELKTPISVLVSNFERLEQENDLVKIKELLKDQKEDTKSLSEIINYLLEISKTEVGNKDSDTKIRIDELIFDLVDELNMLYPGFQFSVDYAQAVDDENTLTVTGNQRLIKAAFSNLMLNCLQYSNDNHGSILISPNSNKLSIEFTNFGPVLKENEKPYMFQHFFRGENSKGKRGFGLGLVFIRKIIMMHEGEVFYTTKDQNTNTFTIILPLS